MTIIQYLNAFRVYSADALVLALGVTLVTSLLKKTVLKSCPHKVYVILPFVLGFLFYAGYRALVTLSAAPFTTELSETFEGGFACGCAATLYHVVYEQFFRNGANDKAQTVLPVSALLKGLIAEADIPAAAKKLTDGCAERKEEERLSFALETLRDYVTKTGNEISEAELVLYAKAVSDFLAALPA